MTTRRLHPAWIVLGAVTVCLLASTGLRATFGVYIKPIEDEIGWSRGALSIAAAISLLLLGASGPFAGRLADRWGPRRVIVIVARPARHRRRSPWRSCTPCGSSTSPPASSWRVGAGGAALSTGSAVVARWFETHRGTAIGFAAGGMSAGQLIVIPLASWLDARARAGARAPCGSASGLLAIVLPLGGLVHAEHARGARLAAVRRRRSGADRRSRPRRRSRPAASRSARRRRRCRSGCSWARSSCAATPASA